MDDSDEDSTINRSSATTNIPAPTTTKTTAHHQQPKDHDLETREKLLGNEVRGIRNRGFHDGYEKGKKSTIQKSFDSGYKKAFGQNFALSTLKGVAEALKNTLELRQSSPDSPQSYSPSTNLRDSAPTTSSSSTTLETTSTSGGVASNSSSSSNVSCNTTDLRDRYFTNNKVSSSNVLLLLETMDFNNVDNIESIKKALIQICRESRLEILAHYVSQIG